MYSLRCAVREGNLKRVTELIDTICVSSLEAGGYVLLRDAIENKNISIAKFLLENNYNVNSKSIALTSTPLHFAVYWNDIELVQMLLNRQAKVNAQDNAGNTPLHNAINKSDTHIIELLLNHGASVNLINKKGYSALHFAAANDNEAIIKSILNNNVNVNCQDINGKTPLHIATENGYLQNVEHLLKHGALINSKCTSDWKQGYTSLHIAAKRGYGNIVKLLLSNNAHVDAITKENWTPLHIAIKNKHETIVELLLNHGANVDVQDKDGQTIIYFAINAGYSITELILKYRPDVNNESNKTCINYCVYHNKDTKIVESLLQYGFTVNPDDKNNHQLLHAAVKNGHFTIVEQLLKYGADVNMSTEKDSTLLHAAVEYEQAEIIQLLLNYGADVNARDNSGKSPIFYAIKKSNSKIMKLLLSNDVQIKDSAEIFLTAVKSYYKDIVEVLIEHDFDVNASNQYGETALHLAIQECNFIPFDYDTFKMEDMVKLLLNSGANVNAQTKEGLTALHFASRQGFFEVVKVLLESNADVNSVSDIYPEVDIFAPFDLDFLNKGEKVIPPKKDKITALHAAIEGNHAHVVELLLEYGANAKATLINGMTSLHIAAEKNRPTIVEILLKFGADIDSRDADGRTPLHIACTNGYQRIIIILLAYGSDINIMTKSMTTPLLCTIVKFKYFHKQLTTIRFHRHLNSASNNVRILVQHIIKLRVANLYLSDVNLKTIITINDKFRINNQNTFQEECEKEIELMRNEKISNKNVSFYDILTKVINNVIKYRNINIKDILKSEDYKTKFPLYANIINVQFRKGLEKQELFDESTKICYSLSNSFSELPYNCTEQIFNYLSTEDLKMLIKAYKSDTNDNVKNI